MEEPFQNQEVITEEEYIAYAKLCKRGLRIVNAHIKNFCDTDDNYGNDIITYRIKSYKSAMEKCERKNYPPTLDGIKEQMQDVAGLRAIMTSIDDIYRVRNNIYAQPGLEVIEEHDYIKNPKENGYSSLHLIVIIQVYYDNMTKSVPVEIQLRTYSMQGWAAAEHKLIYKSSNPSDEAKAKLKHSAAHSRDFDNEVVEMFEEQKNSSEN
jgi:putative GTP pyrophosphokinase